MIKIKVENGYYIFKLDDLLKNENISVNKLTKDTNTDFKVIKRMISGNLTRLDIFVMARLCNYLKCSMEDIVEYQKQSVAKINNDNTSS